MPHSFGQILNDHPKMYASAEYWDSRFAVEEFSADEWLLSYDDLKPILWPLVAGDVGQEVLVPGCGNSGAALGVPFPSKRLWRTVCGAVQI